MSVLVSWNDQSKVFIESHFQDPWSLEEFLDARKAWHRMIKSVDYPVPILLDLRDSDEMPAGALRHFCAIHRTPHPRQGHLYVLGRNATFEKLSPYLCAGVVDPAKALRRIESVDHIVQPS